MFKSQTTTTEEQAEKQMNTVKDKREITNR